MRKILHIFSLLCFSWCCVVSAIGEDASKHFSEAPSNPVAEAGQVVRLLHVGNSFSENAVEYLPQLAKERGKSIQIFSASLPGCSLERHVRHLEAFKSGEEQGSPYRVTPQMGEGVNLGGKASLSEALEASEWDFVTIQQASRFSFLPETYEPYATRLIAEIREKAPQAQILIHQTWSYRCDHPLYRQSAGLTPETMHERLTDAYRQLGERHGLAFLPSGNAVWHARHTPRWADGIDPDYDYGSPAPNRNPVEKGLYPGNYWRRKQAGPHFERDSFHLNTAGKYLAGCVWYEILFNDSVLDAGFVPEGLSAEDAEDLRRIAHRAVAEYRQRGNKL